MDDFWGDEIITNGVRPEWLDEQAICDVRTANGWVLSYSRNGVYNKSWSWCHPDGSPNILAIRFPIGHVYYQTAKTKLTLEQAAGLVAQGRKVVCPFCDRRFMSQCYKPFSSSGIGQHIRARHPEHVNEVISLAEQFKKDQKRVETARERAEKEKHDRVHMVTGAFLLNLLDYLDPWQDTHVYNVVEAIIESTEQKVWK